jgi:hypothetical protein
VAMSTISGGMTENGKGDYGASHGPVFIVPAPDCGVCVQPG